MGLFSLANVVTRYPTTLNPKAGPGLQRQSARRQPVVQTQILVAQGLLRGSSSEKAPYYRGKGPGVQGLKTSQGRSSEDVVHDSQKHRCWASWGGRNWGRTDRTGVQPILLFSTVGVRLVPLKTHDLKGFRPDSNWVFAGNQPDFNWIKRNLVQNCSLTLQSLLFWKKARKTP